MTPEKDAFLTMLLIVNDLKADYSRTDDRLGGGIVPMVLVNRRNFIGEMHFLITSALRFDYDFQDKQNLRLLVALIEKEGDMMARSASVFTVWDIAQKTLAGQAYPWGYPPWREQIVSPE